MNARTQVAFTLAMFFSCVWAVNVFKEQKEVLDHIFKDYDRRIRPNGKSGAGPVVVVVNMYVRHLTIDDTKMMYSAQLTLRQHWYDERLKFNSSHLSYVTLSNPDQLWVPDIFFSNEMRGHFHKILTPNNLIRIYPDGDVRYSTRVSLDLSCLMDLRNYPLDKQVCSLVAASYGYTTEDVVFLWLSSDPVQITKKISSLPMFSLNSFLTDYCTSRTNTGEYSCIKVDLHFSRDFTFYLLRVFMPTISLVVLSWITLLLHPRSITTRMGLLICILVSSIIVNLSIAESEPKVSYIKAIDVWMGTCIAFVFCILVETIFVNNAVTKDDIFRFKNQMEHEETIAENKGLDLDDGVKGNSNRLRKYKSAPLRWLNKYRTKAQRIDVISRVIFPAAFMLFNFVYWPTYTSGDVEKLP